MTDWHTRFLALADHIAGWSKDRNKQVGAVVVGPHREIRATGYNGMPRGVDDDAEERHQRPEKYFWMVHAEKNCIFDAARRGVSLSGCIMYVRMFPCHECAQAIAQAGIKQVVTTPPDFGHPRWGESWRRAHPMLVEAGVDLIFL